MIFKNLKNRLFEAESRLAFIEGELYEIRELLKSNSHSESEAEISCAGLIDEWVNGKEEK
ncbi:MAG: hypothetical protein IKC74_04140 [Clostridia bacterium]|nr:hypothetical protein [Clostridia bacterium]